MKGLSPHVYVPLAVVFTALVAVSFALRGSTRSYVAQKEVKYDYESSLGITESDSQTDIEAYKAKITELEKKLKESNGALRMLQLKKETNVGSRISTVPDPDMQTQKTCIDIIKFDISNGRDVQTLPSPKCQSWHKEGSQGDRFFPPSSDTALAQFRYLQSIVEAHLGVTKCKPAMQKGQLRAYRNGDMGNGGRGKRYAGMHYFFSFSRYPGGLPCNVG